jgi:hypothetical protein
MLLDEGRKQVWLVLTRQLGLVFTTTVLLIIGAVAVWAQQPFLVPSLASAVFVQTLAPHEPSATIWSASVGQLAGVVGGFVGLFLFAANTAPSFMDGHALTLARVGAAGIGGLVTAGLQLGLRAINPAGGATAIILAVGAESADWAGAGRLLCGISLVTLLGEAARLTLLRMQKSLAS